MECTFSIEMKSKKYVKRISLSNESREHVLFEGSLGELVDLSLIEGAVLKVEGASGVLRIDMSENELHKALSKK